ncbi:hypothetical protein [Streptomyces mirabilis]|uniref:hypothetical protein n=1 Tax=Streptomyces mirabilis TaxID=68239 RepID=UPI0036DC1A31
MARAGGTVDQLAPLLLHPEHEGGRHAWFIALYYAVALDLPTPLLDADATSQSAYDWFKVATAQGFDIPANLVVERYPFDDIAEYIRAKRAEFGAIVIDAGGGSAKLFHEAATEANRLIVPVAPTKIERRKLIATFDEAERAAARNARHHRPRRPGQGRRPHEPAPYREGEAAGARGGPGHRPRPRRAVPPRGHRHPLVGALHGGLR